MEMAYRSYRNLRVACGRARALATASYQPIFNHWEGRLDDQKLQSIEQASITWQRMTWFRLKP